MEPLKQWICDVCGELIASPEDGYVVWKTDGDQKILDIRIIHKNNLVDGERVVGCDTDRSYSLSVALESFLGDEGKVRLLSMFDPGPEFCDEYVERIADIRMYLEVYRRLQIPYYEEARLYWDRARHDGFFAGANEVWTYLPRVLKSVIEEYSE